MRKSITILCILSFAFSGCKKSAKDFAGIYKSEEIQETIKGTHAVYYSTTWVLDLAEAKTFILRERKFRKYLESKKYAPTPAEGKTYTGNWELEDRKVFLKIRPFVPPKSNEGRDAPLEILIPLSVESSGELVAGETELSGAFPWEEYSLEPIYNLLGTRFKNTKPKQ